MRQSARWLRDRLAWAGAAFMGLISNQPGGEERKCKIIQGPVALSAQLALLVIVLTALGVKRHRERPRRAWNVFLLDISKQGVSSGAGHLCGMLIALFAHRAPAAQGASECSLYFVVYFMDATLGITLAILFHKAMAWAAHLFYGRMQSFKDDDERSLHWTESLIESGNYGDPPNYRKWAIQVAGWATCVVSARLSVGVTLLLTLTYMSRISRALDRAFKHHVDLELFVVMVGIPMLLNVGQAWIQDQVLKWKIRRHSTPRWDSNSVDDDNSGPNGELQVLVAPGHGRNRSSERVPLLGNHV